jgi:2-dehydropantoate 2-reductase
MKIIVLGAGAIGGYFGARLVQAGADVRFVVRERRAAQLHDHGLVVRSPHGDFAVPARTLLQAQIDGPADLVLLTCKAWDLDAAIASIAPAMGPDSHVIPLLNGLAHIDALRAAFGAERVAGGSCGIPATLTPEGEVVHLGMFHRISFGALPGTSAAVLPKLQALHERFSATPVSSELAPDMMLALWEKFVGLTTLATMTCLMRSAAGDILGTDDGAALMAEAYTACDQTARAAGHTPREAAMAGFKAILADRQSTMTASMLRDLESGGRTEGAHIVGDMLARARAAGVDPGPLRHAWCHLQASERRRQRETA